MLGPNEGLVSVGIEEEWTMLIVFSVDSGVFNSRDILSRNAALRDESGENSAIHRDGFVWRD